MNDGGARGVPRRLPRTTLTGAFDPGTSRTAPPSGASGPRRMSHAVSPLAPKSYPDLPAIAGVRLATADAGIRYKSRTDVLYVALDEGTQAAGVFTRSKCPSAPVDWCRESLGQGRARALVVNSGNANAFTGLKGREAVWLTADIAARAAACAPEAVFVASTGVIGEPLAAEKFEGVLADCAARAQ